ncbi:hypothetical protein [Sphingobacterium tabacisoli]|uniref:Spheroidene monooxygenase n=1 Tax=Sphingobacterium tabacisoli TaxID=2044855 RepID=A0ABW5L1L5_9SPHI|nr:hypothetical protein [Sphingobacterium tabacisoli]
MSIFSYHLVKTSALSGLKAMVTPPTRDRVPGLIHAECMTGMVLGSPVFSFSRMLIGQLVLFAQWEDEASLDHFLANDSVGKIFANGWHVRLVLARQWGSFTKFDIPKDIAEIDLSDSPVVAVTVARMKLLEVPRFIRWGRPVEKLVRDHPGVLLSLASIRLPRTVSTFSIWRSQKEMTDMVRGHSDVPRPKRHLNAMQERNRKDFHFEFTTLRFKVIAEFGEWKGKRYLTWD